MQELLRKYHTNSYVFREGEAGNSAFVLRTGKVRQFKTKGHGEIALDQMHEGEMFGESALVEKAVRPVSASVVAASEIYVIDRKLYLQHLTALDAERAKALQNLHVFVHRVPLYDSEWRRIAPRVADDIGAKMRALLDSDLAASLSKTADPLINLVAEQLREMAARRLPKVRTEPEKAELRERGAAAPVAKSAAPAAKPAAVPPRPTITSA